MGHFFSALSTTKSNNPKAPNRKFKLVQALKKQLQKAKKEADELRTTNEVLAPTISPAYQAFDQFAVNNNPELFRYQIQHAFELFAERDLKYIKEITLKGVVLTLLQQVKCVFDQRSQHFKVTSEKKFTFFVEGPKVPEEKHNYASNSSYEWQKMPDFRYFFFPSLFFYVFFNKKL